MGIFDMFKKKKEPDAVKPKEKYWSLSTSEGEIIDPSWDQIVDAVENATPEGTLFASLGYINAGYEIEIVQAVGEDGVYRFEALPPKDSLEYGDIYVNDGLTLNATLKLFEAFFVNRRVIGYRSWLVEKNQKDHDQKKI